jgi:hypothetical protein
LRIWYRTRSASLVLSRSGAQPAQHTFAVIYTKQRNCQHFLFRERVSPSHDSSNA